MAKGIELSDLDKAVLALVAKPDYQAVKPRMIAKKLGLPNEQGQWGPPRLFFVPAIFTQGIAFLSCARLWRRTDVVTTEQKAPGETSAYGLW